MLICKHYATCGGCTLQEMPNLDYQALKLDLVRKSLAKAGFLPPKVINFITVPNYSRRRATFSVNLVKGSIGFFDTHSNRVVDITECLVITPKLLSTILAIKQDLWPVLQAYAIHKIMLTETDTGIDIMLSTGKLLDLPGIEQLTNFARTYQIGRISEKFEAPKLIITFKSMAIIGEDYTIDLPLEYFLQATKICETFLKEKLVLYTKPAKAILDLYSGVGNYSIAMAQNAPIHAVEAIPVMVEGLRQAAKGKRVKASIRNLNKRPLLAAELADYDYVVVNPPRTGALPQIQAIAKAKLRNVIMISCNSLTFARDSFYLQQAGYRLVEMTAIDQFLYTQHIEIMAFYTLD